MYRHLHRHNRSKYNTSHKAASVFATQAERRQEGVCLIRRIKTITEHQMELGKNVSRLSLQVTLVLFQSLPKIHEYRG